MPSDAEMTADATAPRPEACVISPDCSKIAYVRRVPTNGQQTNQIFVLEVWKCGR